MKKLNSGGTTYFGIDSIRTPDGTTYYGIDSIYQAGGH